VGAEIGFFFIPLYIKTIRLSIQFPVDVPNFIPRAISSMLGKFHGKSMIGTSVLADNVSFYHEPSPERHGIEQSHRFRLKVFSFVSS
jgi:hypothetical protein